jgi:hypothetical protein
MTRHIVTAAVSVAFATTACSQPPEVPGSSVESGGTNGTTAGETSSGGGTTSSSGITETGTSSGSTTTSSSGTTGTSSGGYGGDAGTIGPDAGCKRGVATPESTPPSIAFLTDASPASPAISWWYNWGPKGTGQPPAIEFDPMVWGSQIPASASVDGAPYLLTFNEPDNPQQSNMSPSQAAALWPQIESLAKAKGIPAIVSPAVSSSLSWMEEFMTACSGCQVDYIAVHFYGCTLDTAGQWIGLTEYLAQFYPFNRPIWLTEFSCDVNQTVAQQTAYMQVAIPYLESNAHVFRYSWFSAAQIPNGMLSRAGALTPLGQRYVSLPQACK